MEIKKPSPKLKKKPENLPFSFKVLVKIFQLINILIIAGLLMIPLVHIPEVYLFLLVPLLIGLIEMCLLLVICVIDCYHPNRMASEELKSLIHRRKYMLPYIAKWLGITIVDASIYFVGKHFFVEDARLLILLFVGASNVIFYITVLINEWNEKRDKPKVFKNLGVSLPKKYLSRSRTDREFIAGYRWGENYDDEENYFTEKKRGLNAVNDSEWFEDEMDDVTDEFFEEFPEDDLLIVGDDY